MMSDRIILLLIVLIVGATFGSIASWKLKPSDPIPVPSIRYIERNTSFDRMFEKPDRFTPPINTLFVVKLDTVREERMVSLPTGFADRLLISEPEPIRFRRSALYYRYFDTEADKLMIARYSFPEKNWRLGVNIDLLAPGTMAINPYLTYKGIGATALAYTDINGNTRLMYGARINFEF